MIHSLVIGLTLSITPKADFSAYSRYLATCNSNNLSLVNVCLMWMLMLTASLVTAIFFHQLFEGLSLGIRIASLPPPMNKTSRSLLAPALSALFAVTTPVGILIGLLSLGGGQGGELCFHPHPCLSLTTRLLSMLCCIFIVICSTPPAHAGPHVRHIRRHAHLRRMRRDARSRLRKRPPHAHGRWRRAPPSRRAVEPARGRSAYDAGRLIACTIG